jgi:hypothetical protein
MFVCDPIGSECLEPLLDEATLGDQPLSIVDLDTAKRE